MQVITITGLETSVAEAIAYAEEKGTSMIAAAGNSATAVYDTPAWEPGAICVGATERNELKSWFSELPNKPDLKAIAASGGAGLTSCKDDIVSTMQ